MNTQESTYASIQPIGHNIKDLQDIMQSHNKTELFTLKAVNDLATMTYKEVLGAVKKWDKIKLYSLIASLLLLVITMILLYTSPVINQSNYAYSDIRVWGMGSYLLIPALLASIVLDIGRSYILDRGNNSGIAWTQYIFFTLVSITFSTIGMLAVANFYASANLETANTDINTARTYTMQHAAMAGVSMASLDAQQARYDKKYHTKGTGYKRADHDRDTARLNAERAELKQYLSAKAVLDGKQKLLANTDSSNWIYNTFATIAQVEVVWAGLMIGVLVNLIAELMAMVAHSRLIRLNARLEITVRRWDAAIMAAERATIVNNSSLQRIASLDTFQHVFSMPERILSRYEDHNVSLGDFVNVEVVEDQPQPTSTVGTSRRIESESTAVKEAKARHAVAKLAKRGDTVDCPSCAKPFTKANDLQLYCSNRGAGNCSDEYKNLIDPTRLNARRR